MIRALMLALIGLFVILLALAAIVAPVFAHSWYDPSCCSEQDCAPVPAGVVTAVPGGWLVRLQPGDHFMIKEPMEMLVPYADALESQDGSFHVCIVNNWAGGTPTPMVRCLYAPPMGT